MKGRLSSQAGFTIVELVIALALMGLVSAQLMIAFSAQQRTYTSTDKALEVQEDARLIVDLISFDTRVAGFMVPANVAVSSEDGGTSEPDTLCLSDTSYFQVPDHGSSAFSVLDSKTEAFFGSSITTGSGTLLTLDTLDIDGESPDPNNPSSDFTVGAGVIFSNGTDSWCRKIATIAGNQLTLEGDSFPSVGGGTAVPAVIYELDPNVLALSRNDNVLANQVEDLQVEYWVDTSNDNMLDAGEFPIHDLHPGTGLDSSRVRRVRITVVTRSSRQEQTTEFGTFNHYTRPAVANRTDVDPPDAFKRRRFQVSILPRNPVKDDPV